MREPVILQVSSLLGLIVAVFLVLVWTGQRRLIYRPDATRIHPSAEGLTGVAEVVLEAADGAKLMAWHVEATDGRPTVLYLHGNGGGLYERSARLRILQSAGYGVLMLAYRGYSGSTGQPSEAANVADAKMAYDWLRGAQSAQESIVVFGESLGTGVAVQVAADKPVAGVILDSPFTSLVDVAAGHFPFVPIRWLLRDRYMSMDHIGRVRAPLLIVHGEQDRVVPFALGQRLFAAAHQPKRHVAFPGVGHLVPFDERGWPIIRAFLEERTSAHNP